MLSCDESLFSSEYNLFFNGDEAIMSIFISVCEWYAHDGFIQDYPAQPSLSKLL